MNFPKKRFLFKTSQQLFLSIFYFCLLNYASYLFYPISTWDCMIIVICLAVIGIALVYVEFTRSNPISRFCIELLDSLNWFALMILFLVLAIAIFNFLAFPLPIVYDRLLLILVVGLFIYGYYNAHNPQITERTLYLDDLDEEIDIIHLSDIHVGSIRTPSILKKIVAKINALDADAVIISGDLADGSNRIQPNDFEEFEKVKVPVIFTPGNHDYYTGIENVFNACENAGIMILDNNQTKIGGLNVYGIGFGSDETDFNVAEDENNLLILHIPHNVDEYYEMGFDVILSGHTHGGQFYPANLWVGAVFPLLRGLYEHDGKYVNVSDGAGTMGPPVRIGTKSEVGLLKLRKRP